MLGFICHAGVCSYAGRRSYQYGSVLRVSCATNRLMTELRPT